MLKVWVLSAIMGNGFSMMPVVDETACYTLMKNLHSTVTKPECSYINLFIESSIYAPEIAPIPKEKPSLDVSTHETRK